MNTKELAQALNNRFNGYLSAQETQAAEEHGIVVVWSYDDDYIEFDGAIEGGIYGNEAYIDGKTLKNKPTEGALKIKVILGDDFSYEFTYEVEIPHETFNLIDEDGEIYCRGIVFALSDVPIH